MLAELAVRELGVIGDLSLRLGPGMTALTGETGAGKTLLVEAIELLVGGRSDATLVRPGADEARVQGRFVLGDDREVVLTRAVPAQGRTRAYVDGELAAVGQLGEWGARLVDLHGQHSHQSLLSVAAQRQALDRFGDVDPAPLASARAELVEIDAARQELGGDPRSRAREIDLLRFQVAEIDAAQLDDPDEEERLEQEEDRLADAVAHREAGAEAVVRLTGDGGARDAVAAARAAIGERGPFTEPARRLTDLAAELDDVAATLRAATEAVEEDPQRLAEVRARRQLVVDLRRKYGDTLGEVMAFRDEAASRLAQLERHDERAVELDQGRVEAEKREAAAAAEVGRARREAAPRLAEAVEGHLRKLALPRARLQVDVGPDPGDDVVFQLAANPGGPLLPLRKVASGGELARAMLALRLVLTEAPPVLVFDEVDAGIGGEAAVAVGRALSRLAERHQVLVVTHLPQVAAFADTQVAVEKSARGEQTKVRVRPLDDEDREVELARMLSGSPDSESARRHARELLNDR